PEMLLEPGSPADGECFRTVGFSIAYLLISQPSAAHKSTTIWITTQGCLTSGAPALLRKACRSYRGEAGGSCRSRFRQAFASQRVDMHKTRANVQAHRPGLQSRTV
ncbi:unnamed protein product, partial [Prorocentrum cordatum]